ncbi:hypothetical protein B14911_00660 [Bacillus sp. NRRL B-14911]|nr:hypothetical protein B14911_00660 [Bacillus sp. NRRL B-14911]
MQDEKYLKMESAAAVLLQTIKQKIK